MHPFIPFLRCSNQSPCTFPVSLSLTWYTELLFILDTERVDLSSLPIWSSTSSLKFTGMMFRLLRSNTCVATEVKIIPLR